MADEQDAKRRHQGRSPPFPFIPLERALQRMREFADYSKGHPVRMLSAVAGAWKYNPKSSGGIQTVAALKGFGLIIDSGSGDERKIQISELGRRLLRSPPPQVRQNMVKEAALKPKLISEYWSQWGANRPPDDECLWTLKDERGFTDEAAAKFVSVYDATLAFAGLTLSDTLSVSDEDTEADLVGEPDEEGAMLEEPTAHAEAPARKMQWIQQAKQLAQAQPQRSEWTERLRDRTGLEIVVEFDREPTQGTYEYLRDYINFKLGSAPAEHASPLNLRVLTPEEHAALRSEGYSEETLRGMPLAEQHALVRRLVHSS
ncbi:hypothetical protein ACN9MF_28240 [Methylobacterium fujisawaense]|uniref:hypothetical protein n=1 Tax=Methylobacterium fujisawaense TaxID=107400 RepID=UPI003CF7694D